MLFDEFIKCKLKLLKFLLIVFYGRARVSHVMHEFICNMIVVVWESQEMTLCLDE